MATALHVSKPDNRRKYDDAFKAEALRLAGESCSTRAAARQVGSSEKRLNRWQQPQAADLDSEQTVRVSERRDV